jgi:hypothetical protein
VSPPHGNRKGPRPERLAINPQPTSPGSAQVRSTSLGQDMRGPGVDRETGRGSERRRISLQVIGRASPRGTRYSVTREPDDSRAPPAGRDTASVASHPLALARSSPGGALTPSFSAAGWRPGSGRLQLLVDWGCARRTGAPAPHAGAHAARGARV